MIRNGFVPFLTITRRTRPSDSWMRPRRCSNSGSTPSGSTRSGCCRTRSTHSTRIEGRFRKLSRACSVSRYAMCQAKIHHALRGESAPWEESWDSRGTAAECIARLTAQTPAGPASAAPLANSRFSDCNRHGPTRNGRAPSWGSS